MKKIKYILTSIYTFNTLLMDKNLDKYYTKLECVKKIVDITIKMFPEIKNYVEPSAGCGNISNYIKNLGFNVIAYDVLPENNNIIKADYLKTEIEIGNHITIGNPPFGYKGDLALKFLNKALFESCVVAFIMPITALKYSFQKQVNKEAKLIYQEILDKNSFELPNKEEYSCPSVFQIWSLYDFKKDLRETQSITKHKDFELYRHNATEISKKYIDYDWDFVIYAQGYKDYTKLFYKKDYNFLKEKINNTSDQFYFIKAKDNVVLDNLLKIDYNNLAHTNHITPGFCKNDIIKKYMELYG